MDSETMTIRLKINDRELEITGTRGDVDVYLERYADLITDFREDSLTPTTIPNQSPMLTESDVPETFGEYLIRFAPNITDVDRILVAGYFTQTRDGENEFRTRDVSALLREQGVNIANASEAVRRNSAMRRVFSISRGRFRVSQDGVRHIQSLLS